MKGLQQTKVALVARRCRARRNAPHHAVLRRAGCALHARVEVVPSALRTALVEGREAGGQQ